MKARDQYYDLQPPELDFRLIEEYIAKESTPPLEKIKAINFMADKRREYERRRKK